MSTAKRQNIALKNHLPSSHSGFMMLAELLQAGNPLLQNNPIIVPPQSAHPDEILQRPIPSVASNLSSEGQASTSRTGKTKTFWKIESVNKAFLF
jgi:hypothetical protein